jgi:hypothetical protein
MKVNQNRRHDFNSCEAENTEMDEDNIQKNLHILAVWLQKMKKLLKILKVT